MNFHDHPPSSTTQNDLPRFRSIATSATLTPAATITLRSSASLKSDASNERDADSLPNHRPCTDLHAQGAPQLEGKVRTLTLCGPRETRVSGHLFFWNLRSEDNLPCNFVVHPIRWDRCPLAAADTHARAWITLQSHRGLAYNTLDAYSRGLSVTSDS